MKHPRIRQLCFFSFVLLHVMVGFAAHAEFVLVTNASVGESVTKDEAKQIMLTNKTTWKDGKKIAIFVLSPDTADADVIDKEFMSMTAIQAKRHWLTKVFSGVLHGAPPAVDSPTELVSKVEATPGAFGIILKGTATGKVKTVEVK